jgi:hypothetical protein
MRRLRAALRGGFSLRDAARFAGIPRSTLYRWRGLGVTTPASASGSAARDLDWLIRDAQDFAAAHDFNWARVGRLRLRSKRDVQKALRWPDTASMNEAQEGIGEREDFGELAPNALTEFPVPDGQPAFDPPSQFDMDITDRDAAAKAMKLNLLWLRLSNLRWDGSLWR